MDREKPDALLPTMGGQTALNAAMELNRNGALARHKVKLIGANAKAIAKGEDRQLFKEAMLRIGLDVPRSGVAHSVADAHKISKDIGSFPLIIRPAFTLGGSGGGIAYNPDDLTEIAGNGLAMSPVTEVLIEESLVGWKEFEMEVMRDRMDNCVVVCSIENFDPMGVHTGDSITVAPVQTLTDKEYQMMRDASFAVIREIGVETGGSNIQFAVHPDNGRMVVIEMNPRVSRSSALASQGHGVSDREDRGQARGWLHAGRNQERHHARNAGLFRADDRLLCGQNSAVHFRKVSAGRCDADHANEKRRRSDGNRPHVQGSFAESVAFARDKTIRFDWRRRGQRCRSPNPATEARDS